MAQRALLKPNFSQSFVSLAVSDFEVSKFKPVPRKMAVPALKVGFIGSGKMATALAKGFIQGKSVFMGR